MCKEHPDNEENDCREDECQNQARLSEFPISFDFPDNLHPAVYIFSLPLG
jgi:hypothetical protein